MPRTCESEYSVAKALAEVIGSTASVDDGLLEKLELRSTVETTVLDEPYMLLLIHRVGERDA